MQKSRHAALLQQTNNLVVGIRQAELHYYLGFYHTFGAQSAIIAGFVYCCLTQIKYPDNFQHDPIVFSFVKCAFWTR